MAISLDFQGLNLRPQSIELLHLAKQKTACQAGLFNQAAGGEDVGIAKLAVALTEVMHLDPALFDQRLQTIIQPTQTYSNALREFTLG